LICFLSSSLCLCCLLCSLGSLLCSSLLCSSLLSNSLLLCCFLLCCLRLCCLLFCCLLCSSLCCFLCSLGSLLCSLNLLCKVINLSLEFLGCTVVLCLHSSCLLRSQFFQLVAHCINVSTSCCLLGLLWCFLFIVIRDWRRFPL